MEKYDVFISFKNTDNGKETLDCKMADELYHALTRHNIKTFFSKITLTETGTDLYKKYIEAALDSCVILFLVGTSVKNINSEWVSYEWDSFHEDLLDHKKTGRMFSYIQGILPTEGLIVQR